MKKYIVLLILPFFIGCGDTNKWSEDLSKEKSIRRTNIEIQQNIVDSCFTLAVVGELEPRIYLMKEGLVMKNLRIVNSEEFVMGVGTLMIIILVAIVLFFLIGLVTNL